MASVRIEWNGTDRAVRQRIGEYGRASKDALYALAQYWAPNLEAYAKANAPWTDRTGNARQGLQGRAYQTSDAVIIALGHSPTINYGLWLEVLHQGRYAIIMPTLEAHYRPVWDSVRRTMGGR